MKLIETSDGLQVKHIPGCMWFLGIVFIIVSSTFIYGFFGGFSNYDEIKTWEFFVGLLVAISVLIGGVYVISTHHLITTNVSGKDKTVTILQRNFLRKNEQTFKFAEVIGFEVIEEKDSDDDSFFYVFLKTNRGENIKINSNGIQVEDYALEIKDELNRYLSREKLLNS